MKDNTELKSNDKQQEMEIPKEAILKMPELKRYSIDFVRVLLTKESYKPSEAIAIVEAYFKKYN